MSSTISPIQAPQAAEAKRESDSSLTRLAGDYNSFLNLLTAQVSNQDPLQPMDSSTFVTQLAQLSQVEQSVRINTNLEDISAQIAGTAAMAELHLLGRNATVTGDQFRLSDRPVELGYQLADEASEVTAKIVALDGEVVRTIQLLPTSPGVRHFFEWDGLDQNGQPVAAEEFTLDLEATTSDDEEVPFSGYVSAAIDSIILDGDMPRYALDNGDTVSSERIVAVN